MWHTLGVIYYIRYIFDEIIYRENNILEKNHESYKMTNVLFTYYVHWTQMACVTGYNLTYIVLSFSGSNFFFFTGQMRWIGIICSKKKDRYNSAYFGT